MFKSSTMGIVALTMLSSEVQAMKSHYRPVVGSNPWHKDASKTSWEKPDWKVDYAVPNFGQDHDIKHSMSNLSNAEKKLGTWKVNTGKKAPGPPQDYFVPNFGLDKDIKDTQAHIAQQEKKHGKWVPVQDDNGVWIVPGPANNKSYTYHAVQTSEGNLIQL